MTTQTATNTKRAERDHTTQPNVPDVSEDLARRLTEENRILDRLYADKRAAKDANAVITLAQAAAAQYALVTEIEKELAFQRKSHDDAVRAAEIQRLQGEAETVATKLNERLDSIAKQGEDLLALTREAHTMRRNLNLVRQTLWSHGYADVTANATPLARRSNIRVELSRLLGLV